MNAARTLLAGGLALAMLGLAQQRETVSKPLTERQKKKRDAQLRKELSSGYHKWLDEDVRWIITDEERAVFLKLGNDEEREQFIEQFWLRRDPTPDTLENEFKEEHYRRIAYAGEHYASGIPGWMTDRGRIYIMYGMPDDIEDHSSGGTYERPPEEGGGSTSTFPFQKWRYRHLEGIGENIELEFVDPTGSGEFHLTMDPSEKDALLYVPGTGLSLMEQLGLSDKSQRFNRTDGTHLPAAFGGTPESMDEFRRLEIYTKALMPPKVKFGDLERESVSSIISFVTLPANVRIDYFPLTDASVFTYVTVQFENRDLQFESKDGFQKATVNLHGRITTMTGRHVDTFEQTVTVESAMQMLGQLRAQKSLYQAKVPMAPGIYRLYLAARDAASGATFQHEYRLDVPRLDPEKPSATLLLADIIEPVTSRSAGTGPFVIGGMKVRPRVGEVFSRGEKMGIYAKVYNLGGDPVTHRPAGQVTYEVERHGTGEPLIEMTEDLNGLPEAASAAQVTVQKRLSLQDLAPGRYTLRLKILDTVRNQLLAPGVDFTVI